MVTMMGRKNICNKLLTGADGTTSLPSKMPDPDRACKKDQSNNRLMTRVSQKLQLQKLS
jgi:hypothetical protein